MNILLIALGGGIGAVMRYILTGKVTEIAGFGFPYGTMAVNIIGSLAMGLLIGYMARNIPTNIEAQEFLAVGVLGGFTTFSAFSLDSINMLQRGQITEATLYIAGSVILSLLALIGGLLLIRHLY